MNVPDSDDYIAGIGKKEAIIIFIAFLIAAAISISIILCGLNIIIAIVAGFSILALTILSVRRDKFDESLLKKLYFVWLFSESQKKYEYQYYDYVEAIGKELMNDGK